MFGVAWVSITITPSSPMITPVLGSPSAVKAYRPSPSWVKETFLSSMSPVEAKAFPGVLAGAFDMTKTPYFPSRVSGSHRASCGNMMHNSNAINWMITKGMIPL